MTMAKIFGHAWIFDTGDNPEVSLWEHELIPMEMGKRDGAEWAKCHFDELDNKELREMFGLPETGNFQVIFTGAMVGEFSHGFDGDEWDEWFEVDADFKSVPVPDDFVKLWTGEK